MARLKYAEIAAVEGGDARDVQALSHSHDAAVDNVKLGCGVLHGNILDHFQVRLYCGRKSHVRVIEERKEIQAPGKTEISPKQVVDFWQDDIRHQNHFVARGSEVTCSLVASVACVV